MKYNIDIYFFDKLGRKVGESLNTPPGIEHIDSDGLTQYIIECLPRKKEKK